MERGGTRSCDTRSLRLTRKNGAAGGELDMGVWGDTALGRGFYQNGVK